MSKLSNLEFFQLNVGRQISRYVCDILRDDDKLVAQVSGTVMTLRGDQSSGR